MTLEENIRSYLHIAFSGHLYLYLITGHSESEADRSWITLDSEDFNDFVKVIYEMVIGVSIK